MKRILRSFLTLLMLVVWASGFAADKTYSYTFVRGGVFTEAKQTKTLNGISWNFTAGGKTFQYDGTLKLFRVGSKRTPADEITFSTNGFKGTIKSVSIEGRNDNSDGNAKVFVSVGGTAYSGTKQSFTTTIDSYTLTGASSGDVQIKITCTGKSGVLLKSIKVIYEEGTSATATTVSFQKKSLNLIDGDEAAQSQKAVVKAGEKTLTGATVTYSFESADGIFEETTTDGLFSLKAGTYGTGKVTATFDGGEIDGVTYAKSSASYTVNYSAAKTPALTFSVANVTVKQGEESSFVKPTIKFTDERGDDVTAAADIIYTVSPETVVKLDNEGNVTQWLAPGVASITATTEYGKNYYDASYTLTYEKVKLATTLTLDEGLKTTGEIGETLDCPAWTLKAGENVLSGKTVVMTSDNKDVVKVDGNRLKLVAAGSANIILSFKGDDDYQSSKTSYKLTVVDPNAADVTFDFSKPAAYGDYEAPSTNGSATYLEEGNTLTSGVITITNVQNGWTIRTDGSKGTNKSRFHMYRGTIQFRVYDNAVLTLSAADGYVITGFVYNSAKGENLTASTGSYDNVNKKWTGTAKSIELAINDAFQFENMTVTYSKLPSIGLDESKDNTETISGNADKTVNVKLTRTLKADVWNTFCVPFDVTVAGSPLEGATIKQIASVEEKTDGAVINFKDAPATLEAGKAYLVRTATAIVNPTFNGVTVKNVTPTNCSGNDNYQLIGIYSPLNIDALLYGKVFGINNQDKLAKVKENTSIKGMRAYFLLANSATAAKLNFGGELTGIDAVDNGEAVMTGKVYNLNGQYVGNSLEGLKKGVYVVNGKKVLK